MRLIIHIMLLRALPHKSAKRVFWPRKSRLPIEGSVMEPESQSSQQTETSDCKCKAHITDVLARLEKLEREAFTVEKLAEMPPASFIRVVRL